MLPPHSCTSPWAAKCLHVGTKIHTNLLWLFAAVWPLSVVGLADQGKNCSQWLLEVQRLHAQKRELSSHAAHMA